LTALTSDAAACLAFVQPAPTAAAARDKPAWPGLFARYSLVEGPVGAEPWVTRPGGDALARFYDAFVARNQVRFLVYRDPQR
jgi:hypothetical protein